MAATSKLGIACLILAIITIVFFDLRILLVLGFLYYSYKLLYKKEKPTRADKIIIIFLFIIFLLEIFSLLYLATNYIDISELSEVPI